jgi:hypothetical protein
LNIYHSNRSTLVIRCALAALTLAASPRLVCAQPAIPVGFDDALVANVETPTALASTPDGRLLIASQLGRIYVYAGGSLLDSPALDLSATITST